MRRGGPLVVVAIVFALAGLGCSASNGKTPTEVLPGASASVGKQLIARFGCGSCHTIPGVKGANALVGPPLVKFGRRGYIAGELPNTPDNLVRWVHDPKGVEPGTDMPDLGVSVDQARNIAAYLESLR